ncbi:hypothetical protein D3C86_1452130 [compost metagenome]
MCTLIFFWLMVVPAILMNLRLNMSPPSSRNQVRNSTTTACASIAKTPIEPTQMALLSASAERSTTIGAPLAGGGWPVPTSTVAARRIFCSMESSPLTSSPSERESLLAMAGRRSTIDSICPWSR